LQDLPWRSSPPAASARGLREARGRQNGEIATLKKDKTALEQQKATTEQQKTALEQQQASRGSRSMRSSRRSEARRGQPAGQIAVRLAGAQPDEEVKKGELQVRQYKDMLTVDVAEQLFFDSGRADSRHRQGGAEEVSEAVKGYGDKVIRIVGHTDNVPIKTKTFPPMGAVGRARDHRGALPAGNGHPPERMIASGRAEYQR